MMRLYRANKYNEYRNKQIHNICEYLILLLLAIARIRGILLANNVLRMCKIPSVFYYILPAGIKRYLEIASVLTPITSGGAALDSTRAVECRTHQ